MTFTTNETAEICGVSLRQLQWSSEKGILNPSKLGHQRIWEGHHVLEAAVLYSLRRRDVSLKKCRLIMAQRPFRRAVKDAVALCPVYLVTDGETCWAEGDKDSLMVRLYKMKRAALLVDVSEIWGDIQSFDMHRETRETV